MLLPIPEEVLQAQARDRALDALLGSLGISAAVVSASFAAYMIVVGPPGRQAASPPPLLAMGRPTTHAPRTLAAAHAPEGDAVAAERNAIDFDPTGSISPLSPEPEAAERADIAKTILPDFAVRDAFDGTALVEARGTLRMVQPGTVLDGVGKVLAITRRGKGWVVATSGGLILQRR